MQNSARLVSEFQGILQNNAHEKTRIWWEKYLKHEAAFRGVGIPDIRSLLNEWYHTHKIDTWTSAQQFELALQFFDGKFTEDKLTGVLILQIYLIDALDCREALQRFISLYEKSLISDWNICDWFCIRVLGPMIEVNGAGCASKITEWRQFANIWQARSAVIPFVYLKDREAYLDLILSSCRTLIRRHERFSKTAVGWMLRELYKNNDLVVSKFINENLKFFTPETIRNALKYSPEKPQYLQKLKSLAGK